MRISDWSSDVCSSDLQGSRAAGEGRECAGGGDRRRGEGGAQPPGGGDRDRPVDPQRDGRPECCDQEVAASEIETAKARRLPGGPFRMAAVRLRPMPKKRPAERRAGSDAVRENGVKERRADRKSN